MYKVIYRTILLLFVFLISSTIALADQNVPLHIPIYGKGINLDPAKAHSVYSTWISRQINCQLIRADASYPVPEAAESVKYSNSSTINIKLKKDLTFSDKEPVTAYDVVASFRYINKHQTYLRNVSYWMDKIYAVSDRDIIVKLKKPTSSFLQIAALSDLPIYQRHFLLKAEKNPKLWQFPITCGGYKIIENNSRDIYLEPRFKGHPIIFEKIVSTPINNSEYSHFDIIKNYFVGTIEPSKNFKKIQVFEPYQLYLGLNTEKEQWKNKAQRCAFLSKINKQRVLQAYDGYGQAANDLFPIGILGYRSHYQFADKINQAHEVVKQKIKLPDFCLAFFKTAIPTKYNTAYVEMVKQAVDVKRFHVHDIMDADPHAEFLQSNCDAIVIGFQSSTLSGYDFLVLFDQNKKNFTGFYNKDLSNLLLNSQNINDNNQKAVQYDRIADMVRDECIAMPIVTVPMQTFFIKKSLNAPRIGESILEHYYLGEIE